MRPSTLVFLRRRAYSLLLAAAFAGLVSFMVSDAQAVLQDALNAPSLADDGGPRALTSGRSMDGFGAWSPDGKQIAFMRDGRIWLVPSKGGDPRALTAPDAAWDAAPAWRPDGKELAFVRHELTGGKATVMVMDLPGARTRQWAAEEQTIGHLAWSPDGKKLYYTTPQSLVELDEGHPDRQSTVLKVKPEWEMLAGGLAITKDGKAAVFGAGPRMERGVLYDLWMAPLTGQGDPVRLTRDGGIMPDFDRTGTRLVFRNPRQATGIYMMDLASRKARLILRDEPRALYFHPAFSPDGQTLVLSRLLLDGNPGGEGAARFTSNLCLHRLAGSGGD